MSIDEPDEDCEELKGEAEGMPFIIRTPLVGAYGRHFHVYMDDYGLLCVAPRGIPHFSISKQQRRDSFSW
ncbi:hypothetical protein [Mailhella sp.]|uniref:hypothetical protein n=1 Tax=Mailhella sp. TaxID=1981029 RepID=UPI004063DD25